MCACIVEVSWCRMRRDKIGPCWLSGFTTSQFSHNQKKVWSNTIIHELWVALNVSFVNDLTFTAHLPPLLFCTGWLKPHSRVKPCFNHAPFVVILVFIYILSYQSKMILKIVFRFFTHNNFTESFLILVYNNKPIFSETFHKRLI